MSEPRQKFYLTTPIYYVNARPHIGHAYTTIVADVLARRHRLLGEETFFLTGTDEHGQKIERSAAAAGIPPQQFTDQVAAEFKNLWDRMGITYDKFIRTTSPEHALGVQQLWRELEARGFIYLDSYTGSYCVSDEAFVDAPAGTPCPDCGRLLETVTEENYFFRLSEYQLPLLNLIESGELKIENEARKNEVLSFLRGSLTPLLDRFMAEKVKEGKELPGVYSNEDIQAALVAARLKGEIAYSSKGIPYVPGALKDLSISRSSFKWGIPVPGNDKHVIYVWLDALANYITALGYGSDDLTNFDKFWPADLHLVGKEIIRFHCVYWPAFLLAAGLPLPKAITAHGWLLFDNSKMSKSKGNIVRTETILDAFGTLCPPVPELPSRPSALGPRPSPQDLFASDVLRYFLLREIPFGQDGSFSFDALLTRYNAELANGYGNLVSRTLTMIYQNCEGVVSNHREWNSHKIIVTAKGREDRWLDSVDTPLGSDTTAVAFIYDDAFENLRFTSQTEEWRKSQVDFVLDEDSNRSGVIDAVQFLVRKTDEYIALNAPWKLAKTKIEGSRELLEEVLYSAAESIRIITILLHPIMPYATTRVWIQLGLDPAELTTYNSQLTTSLTWGGLKPGTKLGPLSPIFPRADKSLIEIMNNMENETTRKSASPEPSLSSATTPAHFAADATGSTDPAAGPRPFEESDTTLLVAGSAALTAGPDPTPPPVPLTPNTQHLTPASITIDDFAKIELRVAQIVVAERIPKADKLLRLEVDLGPDFPRRQILSGIAEHYTPEELIGRRIVVITNLAPRKMRGLESHGMLLAASDGQNGKPILATFAEDIALGSRLK